MPSPYRFRTGGFSYSGNFPPAVKWLLIANCALFVILFLTVRMAGSLWYAPFALSPRDVLGSFAVWQLYCHCTRRVGELPAWADRLLPYLGAVSDRNIHDADINRLRLCGSMRHYAHRSSPSARALLGRLYMTTDLGSHIQDAFFWNIEAP